MKSVGGSLLFACAVALAGTPGFSQPAVQGVGSYDQIGRLLTGETPPPPDSFDHDAATIAALPPMPRPPGGAPSSALGMLAAIPVVGLIAGIGQELAMMAYAKSEEVYTARATEIGKEYVRAGTLERVTLYRGWSRVDMVRMQTAVIAKPDTGETIYLDLSRRVYRVARVTPSAPGDTYVVSDADDAQPPVVESDAATTALGARVLSGVDTHGYRTTASFEAAATVGRCSAGAHNLDEVEYDSVLPDPQNTSMPAMTPTQIVSEACAPTTTAAHDEPGHLYVFRSTTITNASSGNVTVVSERGNIRGRSDTNISQFAVPSGFSEEKTP